MFRKILVAALISTSGIGALGLPGAASAYEYAPGYASEQVQFAPSPPPPPRVERVPHARRGYVWVPGYWQWRGHRHVWVPGTWIVARPGYAYAHPRWIERDGRWYFERGRWRDRDRDGIPDRIDRRPNDPHRG